MGRVFGAVDCWVRFSKRFRLVQPRPFSTTTTNNNNNDKINAAVRDYDAYRQLDKLDFMTATKILFTTPPKKKKFGIDFHLVQLFFACMPSLAVYLVAQYARYEIRRMEAELELKKKKAEEEEKAKVMESNAIEDKEAKSDPELLKVKVRLDKLEEVVKEIAVETKKQSGGSITKNQEDGDDKEHNAATEPSNTQSRSEASKSAANDNLSKQKSREITPGMSHEGMSGLAPVTDASQEDQK